MFDFANKVFKQKLKALNLFLNKKMGSVVMNIKMDKNELNLVNKEFGSKFSIEMNKKTSEKGIILMNNKIGSKISLGINNRIDQNDIFLMNNKLTSNNPKNLAQNQHINII